MWYGLAIVAIIGAVSYGSHRREEQRQEARYGLLIRRRE